MTLLAKVTARFSNQRLIELTNSDQREQTTVNTTILGLATDDAEAEFQILAGVEYDDNDARHIATAIQGVVYYLGLYRGIATDELDRLETRWQNACDALGKVTSRNRILPTSNSQLTQSDEQKANEIVRPDFDRDNFQGFVTKPPTQVPNLGRPGSEVR